MHSQKGELDLGFVLWLHTPWSLLEDKRFPEAIMCSKFLLSRIDQFESKIRRLKDKVDAEIAQLKALGVSRLRTNVSWAEAAGTPGGTALLDWYIPLVSSEFDTLFCINYTPPDLSVSGQTNSPPKKLDAFALFVGCFLQRYHRHITQLQLWNEPNLRTDWDPQFDADGSKFVTMITEAARTIRTLGKTTVLGGISQVDEWFNRFCRLGGATEFDTLSFHGLRGTWSDTHPRHWQEKASRMLEITTKYYSRQPQLLLTEVGFPTTNIGLTEEITSNEFERMQVAIFAEALRYQVNSNVPMYWYTLQDYPETLQSVRAVTTGWEDQLQHHFGILTTHGRRKLLCRLLEEGGGQAVLDYADKKNLRPLAWKAIHRTQ